MGLYNKTASFSHEFFDLSLNSCRSMREFLQESWAFLILINYERSNWESYMNCLLMCYSSQQCPYYQVKKVFAIKSDISE